MRTLLGLLVLAVSCQSTEGDCLLHSQCTTHEICLDGRCTPPPQPVDAGRAEAGPIDAATPDAATIDAATIDAATIDAATIDASVEAGNNGDAGVFDASISSDVQGVDAQVLDGASAGDSGQPNDVGSSPQDVGPVGDAGAVLLDTGPARD